MDVRRAAGRRPKNVNSSEICRKIYDKRELFFLDTYIYYSAITPTAAARIIKYDDSSAAVRLVLLSRFTSSTSWRLTWQQQQQQQQ